MVWHACKHMCNRKVRFCIMALDNNIGAEGVKALVPVLKHLTQLKVMNLRGEYWDIEERDGLQRICIVHVGVKY